MLNKRLLILLECAISAAIAILLTFIPSDIGSSFSVSLGIIPIYLIAIRRGVYAAGFAGFLWGLLHFVTGKAYILTPMQGFIEYVLAFLCVAFSGMNAKRIRQFIASKNSKSAILWLWLSTCVGGLAKYFWHYVAGVIFWGSYAFKGWGAQLFSIVMNGGSFLVTFVVASIFLSYLIKLAPALFLPKKGHH